MQLTDRLVNLLDTPSPVLSGQAHLMDCCGTHDIQHPDFAPKAGSTLEMVTERLGVRGKISGEFTSFTGASGMNIRVDTFSGEFWITNEGTDLRVSGRGAPEMAAALDAIEIG